jgi:uncharacterized protein YbjQ (UPF0145 family)
MNDVTIAVLVYIVLPVVSGVAVPMTSWMLGRWYQNGLFKALEVTEAAEGKGFGDAQLVSYQKKQETIAAEYTTLLMANIVVGPSWGQMFLMWVKSLFGGALPSYASVLDYGRREAIQRLKVQARERGCTSIVNMRVETSVIATAKGNDSKSSSVEFLAYGTGYR